MQFSGLQAAIGNLVAQFGSALTELTNIGIATAKVNAVAEGIRSREEKGKAVAERR